MGHKYTDLGLVEINLIRLRFESKYVISQGNIQSVKPVFPLKWPAPWNIRIYQYTTRPPGS